MYIIVSQLVIMTMILGFEIRLSLALRGLGKAEALRDRISSDRNLSALRKRCESTNYRYDENNERNNFF